MATSISYRQETVPGEVAVFQRGSATNPSIQLADPNALGGLNDGLYATSTPSIGISINGTEVFEVFSDSATFAQNLTPATSDGAALGTGALMWSDLFLASAGVINFNNGNMTITHAAGNLAVAGGTFDLTVASLGAADIGFPVTVTVSAPNNQSGMSAYFDATINGTTAGHCYGLGSWINTGATSPVLSAGHIIVPFEGGIYAGEAQATARLVFGGQHQAILTGVPASLYAWRLNANAAAGPVTAVIAAANPGSVAYEAGVGAGTAVGWAKMFDIVGPGVVYVKLYSAV